MQTVGDLIEYLKTLDPALYLVGTAGIMKMLTNHEPDKDFIVPKELQGVEILAGDNKTKFTMEFKRITAPDR